MATAQVKHHDYHLVDPSPWPIVGAVAAFIMAVGAITWMHHMFAAAPGIFGIGTIGVLYTMAGWGGRVVPGGQDKGGPHPRGGIHHPLRLCPFLAPLGVVFLRWFLGLFHSG